jgi:TonB family protein
MAVGRALPIARERVLLLTDRGFDIDMSCTSPFDEPAPALRRPRRTVPLTFVFLSVLINGCSITTTRKAVLIQNSSSAPLDEKEFRERFPIDVQRTRAILADYEVDAIELTRDDEISQENMSDLGAAQTRGSTRTEVSCTPPNYQTLKQVDYPIDAILDHAVGTAVIKVTVEASGIPANLSIYTSSGSSSLDDAALSAVTGYRFIPKKCGGHAVTSPALVPVQFSLNDFDKDDVKFGEDYKNLEYEDVGQEIAFLNLRRDTQRTTGAEGDLFYDPQVSSLWIVRTSLDKRQTAVVRIRAETRQTTLYQNYASGCNGSADWCAAQLQDCLDLVQGFPIPVIGQQVID